MRKYFIRNDGEFYKANLHCHSTVSDGKLSPDELKKIYKKHGYSVLAYTDHNILIAHPELRDEEFLPLNSYELSVFTLDKYSGAAGKQYEKPCHLILIAKEENNLDMVCWNRNFLFANAVNYESQAKFKKSEDNYDRVYTPDCINDIINRAHKGGYYVIYAHPTWSGEIYPTYIQYKNLDAMEMIVLPGGLGGVASARASQAALDALRWGWEHDRFVAAICAGPTVLADLGISDGKKATCFPGCEGQMGKADMVPGAAALRDGKLITGTSAGCAIPFALELIKALKGSEAADKVAKQIVIR